MYHLPLQAALPSVPNFHIHPVAKVRNLGVILDSCFSLSCHEIVPQILQFLFPKHLNPSVSLKLHAIALIQVTLTHTQLTIACAQLVSLPPVLPPPIYLLLHRLEKLYHIIPQLNLPYWP